MMHDLSRSAIMTLAAALVVLLAMITAPTSAQSVVYGGDGRTLDSNQAALRDLVLKHAGAWAKPDRADLVAVLASDVLFAYPSAKLDKTGTLNAFDAFVQQYANTTVVIPNGGIIIDSQVGRVSVQWKFSTYARSTGVRQVVNVVSLGKVRTTGTAQPQFVEWLEFVDGQVPALQAAGVLSYEDGADAVVKPWPAFVPGREQCKAVVKASCPLPSYTDGKIHWDLIAATGQKPPAYFDSVGVYDSESGVFYMNGGLMDSTSVTQAKLSNSTFALNVDSQEWFELTSIGGPSARCDATMAMGSSSNLVRVIGGRGAFRTPDPKNPGQFIDTVQRNEYVYNAASGGWTEIPLRQAEANLVGRAAAHRFERTDPVTGERQTCIFGGLGNTLPRWFSLQRGVFADIIVHTPSQGWRVVEPAPGSPVPLGRAWANHAYLPELDVLLVHAGFGNQSQNTSVSPDPSLPLDWVDSNVYDDLWAFNFSTRVWTRLNLPGPHPRERSGGVGVWDPLHKAMVIFGGYDFFGNGTSDFWALNVNFSDLHASRWENLSPRVQGSIPVGRIGAAHFSRVTPEGFEIWIIGGADKDARFNVPPSADIYRVIIPKDLPAPQTPTGDFAFYSGTSAWWMAVTIPGSQSVSIDCGNGQGLTQMSPAWMPNMWTFTSTNGHACGSSLTFVVNGGAAQTMSAPWA
jgi:hypothetical protein